MHPIVYRTNFNEDIIAQMVSWGNPEVQVTNSDLKLAGSVLRHKYMADCFDIRRWTKISRTENTEGLLW